MWNPNIHGINELVNLFEESKGCRNEKHNEIYNVHTFIIKIRK